MGHHLTVIESEQGEYRFVLEYRDPALLRGNQWVFFRGLLKLINKWTHVCYPSLAHTGTTIGCLILPDIRHSTGRSALGSTRRLFPYKRIASLTILPHMIDKSTRPSQWVATLGILSDIRQNVKHPRHHLRMFDTLSEIWACLSSGLTPILIFLDVLHYARHPTLRGASGYPALFWMSGTNYLYTTND